MLIGLIVLLVIAGVFYFLYTQVISKRNTAEEALSGVDVQLTKRHNLIPNVLTIAKKFMEHERGLMEEITKLREQAVSIDPKESPEKAGEYFEVEKQLQTKMGQFMVQVENYPDLKSDTTMLQAQQTYNEVEANIAAARRFYNSSVTDLKNACEIWPSSMIAGMVGVKPLPFFEADEAARAPVTASDYL